MAFCTNCGAPLSDGKKFCTNCGAPVSTASAGPPVQEPAPEPPPEIHAPEQTEPELVTAAGSYTPPQDGYMPTQASYSAPQQSYTPPQTSYVPPQASYTPPQTSYTPPQTSYSPPQSGYAFPQSDYSPPQQGYAPAAYDAQPYAAPVAVKTKKPAKAAPFIIGGAALLVIVIILLVVFAFRGESKSDYIGVWNCIGYETLGVRTPASQTGESSLEFKSLGRVAAVFLGAEGSGRWSETDGGLVIKSGGEAFDCTLDGSLLVLKYGNMYMYFEKEGTVPSAAGSFMPAATEPPFAEEEPSVGAYVGYWEAVGVDTGDGVILTEYEGAAVGDLMSFELFDDYTASILSYGELLTGTWAVLDGGIDITVEGDAAFFSYIDGQLAMVDDSGGTSVTLYLDKMSGSIGQPEEPGAEGLTAAQEQWNGYWYGSFWVYWTEGDTWSDYYDYFSDFYGYIEVDEYGDGFFDADFERFDVEEYYQVVLSMWIEADEYHFEQVGGEAWFSDMEIIEGENGTEYYVVPVYGNDDMFYIYGTYVDPAGDGTDGFDFCIAMVKWGSEWDYSLFEDAPPGYDDYLTEIGGTGYASSGNGAYSLDSLTVYPEGGWDCYEYEDELDFYYYYQDGSSVTMWLQAYPDKATLDSETAYIGDYAVDDVEQLFTYETEFSGYDAVVYQFYDSYWEECALYMFVDYGRSINGQRGFRLYAYSYDYTDVDEFLTNDELDALIASIIIG